MSIFEVTGSSDPLGLWDTAPGMVSFGLGDETTPETAAPVYRVNLSPGEAASSSALAEQLASFERMNNALNEIPSQLVGLVRRKQQRGAAGVSFDVADITAEADPEDELLALLAYSDAAALGGPELESISYGFGEAAGEMLGRAREKFAALLKQVNQDMLNFAWVETKIADLIIARSKVGWISDAHTIWKDETPAEHMLLHHKTLEVVSQTRNHTLRLSLTILTSAAKIAVMMTAPGGTMLALPAVYQYVMKILEQANHLHSIQASSREKSEKKPETEARS